MEEFQRTGHAHTLTGAVYLLDKKINWWAVDFWHYYWLAAHCKNCMQIAENYSLLLPSVFTTHLTPLTSLLLSHLKYVNENIFLWLLGAANVLQDDRVVDALGIRLVQVICVWLVPLLEGKEDLVLICTHYLHILKEWRKEKEGESGVKMEYQ